MTKEVEVLVKEEGKAYYFSHGTIKRMESGSLVFKNAQGDVLWPEYFGAGQFGYNGTLRRKK